MFAVSPMSAHFPPSSHGSLRRYLLAAYASLVVYASLSPFTGWQEQGLAFAEVLAAPWGQTYNAFDALVNWLAYLPLGMLLALALRAHCSSGRSVLFAVLGGVLLSAGMEYLQMYLPNRTSSNVDLLANGLGSLMGAVLASGVVSRRWFLRLAQWRSGLLQQGAGVDFGVALAMLWMFVQINPSLPILGNVFITEAAHRIFVAMPEEPFNIWESAAVALNLLMIGFLLQSVLGERRHAVIALLLILCVVALAKFLAAAVLLKSWALLLWLNSEAMSGIVAGLLLMWGAGRLRGAGLLWGAAIAACAYFVLALWQFDNATASAAMRLYQWHYGHLRNYNNMSHLVSVIFPLLLGIYLGWARKRL